MRAQVRKLKFGLSPADFCKNYSEAPKSGKLRVILDWALNQTLEGLWENKNSSAVIIAKVHLPSEWFIAVIHVMFKEEKLSFITKKGRQKKLIMANSKEVKMYLKWW